MATTLTVLLIGGSAAALFSAALLPVGVALPDIAVTQAVRNARSAVAVALPDALDVIAATLACGFDLERAITLAAGRAGPPLNRILTAAASHIAVGRAPETALEQAARTVGDATLTSAVALIARHRRLGLPVAPSLYATADEARSRAHIAVAEQAARAGPLAALLTAGVVAPACVGFLVVILVGGLAQRGGVLGSP